MNSRSSQESVPPPPDTRPQSPEEAYQTLRKLILGAENTQIERILRRIEDPRRRTKDISQVLPEAVVLQTKQNSRMVPALRPTVEQIIHASVKRDPKPLVDALFPIIGPAIRKSVAEAFRQMMQSLNTTLEHSTSLKGIQWRIQALRTGKPFAEVVLLNTLLYRVEQVFLIHRETGLLLNHAVAEGVIVQDGDMVSGMLTAINDFIRDSFTPRKNDALTTIRLGETTVVLEEGPHAYLAGVVRGNPPEQLRVVFRKALETIHLEFGQELIDFDGDTAPLETATPYLETCLRMQQKSGTRKTSPVIWIITAAIIGLSLFWGARWVRNQMHWTRYLNRLRDTPGLVVTQAEKRHGIFQVSGLRDPLADNPADLIPDGLDPDQIAGHWEPFYAMQPQFILMRARQLSHPPASTTLTLADNILTASGSAPMAWITRNRPVLSTLPGISRYDDSRLAISDLDALLLEKARLRLQPPKTVALDVKNGHLIVTGRASHQWVLHLEKYDMTLDGIGSVDKQQLIDSDAVELERIRRDLEQAAIRFSRGTQLAEPGATTALDRTARLIYRLQEASGRLKTTAIVEILGHTDVAGSEEKNRRLRRARANIIRDQLIKKGVTPAMLRIADMQTQEASYMKKATSILMTGRRVTFQIDLLKQHQTG